MASWVSVGPPHGGDLPFQVWPELIEELLKGGPGHVKELQLLLITPGVLGPQAGGCCSPRSSWTTLVIWAAAWGAGGSSEVAGGLRCHSELGHVAMQQEGQTGPRLTWARKQFPELLASISSLCSCRDGVLI